MRDLFIYRTAVTPVALLLACGLLIAGHPVAPAAISGTLVLTMLITVAKNPILYISSLGSLGMAIGASIDHHPILSCCLSPFTINTLFSWPTLLMCLFCLGGNITLFNSRRHRQHSCTWTTLPVMYFGMCLAGHYLSTPLQTVFGPFLATHWTMFFGMVVGHGLGHQAIRALPPIKLPKINNKHESISAR